MLGHCRVCFVPFVLIRSLLVACLGDWACWILFGSWRGLLFSLANRFRIEVKMAHKKVLLIFLQLICDDFHHMWMGMVKTDYCPLLVWRVVFTYACTVHSHYLAVGCSLCDVFKHNFLWPDAGWPLSAKENFNFYQVFCLFFTVFIRNIMGWKNTYDTNLESGHKKVSLKATNTACTFWNCLLVRRAQMML